MRNDPVVEEIRAARQELHDEFGGDTAAAALFQYLKQLEAENSERLVKLEPKPAISGNRKAS
jgi:hypothetical protein